MSRGWTTKSNAKSFMQFRCKCKDISPSSIRREIISRSASGNGKMGDESRRDPVNIPRTSSVSAGNREIIESRLAQERPTSVPVNLTGNSGPKVRSKSGCRNTAEGNHAALV